MNLTGINLREKKFHNELQLKNKPRKENIFYKAISTMFEDFEKYIKKNSQNKNILDFGCGVGSITERVAKYQPAKLVGIDISEISITKAKENAKNKNLDIVYISDNCEKSKLTSSSYDLIYGSGILHHLNLELCVKEINRLLKKEGTIVFMEPLGTNPLINLYRKLTPNSRSSDEHPFLKKDFDFLKKNFSDVNIKYYGFLTLLFFLFYKNPQVSNFFRILTNIDNFLFRFKYLKKLAWSVLIICKKN